MDRNGRFILKFGIENFRKNVFGKYKFRENRTIIPENLHDSLSVFHIVVRDVCSAIYKVHIVLLSVASLQN